MKDTRRKFLLSMGAIGSTALAGCTTAGQGDDSERNTPVPRTAEPEKSASERYDLRIETAPLWNRISSKSGFSLNIYYNLIDKETGESIGDAGIEKEYVLPGFDVKLEYKPLFEPEGEVQQTDTISIDPEDIVEDYRPTSENAGGRNYFKGWALSASGFVDTHHLDLESYTFDEMMDVRVSLKFSDEDEYNTSIDSSGTYWTVENPVTGEVNFPAPEVLETDLEYHVPILISRRISHPYREDYSGPKYGMHYAEWVHFDKMLFEQSRRSNNRNPLEWDKYWAKKTVVGYTKDRASYMNLPMMDEVAQVFKNWIDAAKVSHPGVIAEIVQGHVLYNQYAGDLDSMAKETYLRHPAELLVDQEGDCTDFAFYMATLFSKLGFETCLVNCLTSRGETFHITASVQMPSEFEPPWADGHAHHLKYVNAPPNIDTERQLYVECVTDLSIGRVRPKAANVYAMEVINKGSDIYLADPVGEHHFEYNAPTDLLW